MAPLPIIVGGTVAIDNVITPHAEARNLLGGSAAYAALAASYFSRPVHVVGIIGHDFPAPHLAMLESHGISLDGIERSPGESFTWTGEYHANMNDRTTHLVGLNVLQDWEVSVPAAIAACPIVVLANMSPGNQAQMLHACTAERRFVIADTMDLWINIANAQLQEVLKQLDLFVINDSEAREFTGTSNIILAGRRLLEKGPRFVIVKLGEFGAMLFAGDHATWQVSETTFFRASAFPLGEVIDPTGAGDTFLGAVAGHLASLSKTDFTFADLRHAVVKGTVLASFTCEQFSTRRLEALTHAEISQREDLFRALTDW
jgi:sugar/nucleoside kinase (ribokinase family)